MLKFLPIDKVERCFDIVAVFGNDVQRVFREILSLQQTRNKSNMFNLFRHCRKDEISFDIVTKIRGNVVAETGNNVEATFDFVDSVLKV